MIHLVTYHTPDMSISAQRCKESALKHGVDKVYQWTRAALEQTEFYEQNKELLDQPRGSGYWAWKAFVILEALKQVKEGDTLIYMDVGVDLIKPLHYLMPGNWNILLFGNMYDHQHWCKMDIMEAIGCHPNGKQCQASVILVRPTARNLIEKWLHWCLVPGLIDDSPSKAPNHPEFKDNRHDQAILTVLADMYGIPLHWWPAIYNNGAFTYPKDGYSDNYPALFHHHRKRNSEY